MNTKYGYIKIIVENGVKKVDFEKSNLIKTNAFYSFLNDKILQKDILGY